MPGESAHCWNSLRQTATWLKASDALALADYCQCRLRQAEAEADKRLRYFYDVQPLLTLGVFLVLTIRNPLASRSLIAFTA
jgi:hypothetical protein